MEAVFQSTGICGSPWRGNSMGSLLWNRNHFAFPCAEAKFVRGVEIVPAAIEDARRNAHLNEIDNVEFFVGKAEEVLPREYEKMACMQM